MASIVWMWTSSKSSRCSIVVTDFVNVNTGFDLEGSSGSWKNMVLFIGCTSDVVVMVTGSMEQIHEQMRFFNPNGKSANKL